MLSYLCITIRFLQPYYHGRADGDEPEWPPSPLRVLQALVAASATRWRNALVRERDIAIIRWLERQSAPLIFTPASRPASVKYRLYVPDNIADKVAKSWASGREASIADFRTEKDVRPTCLPDDSSLHYLWAFADDDCPNHDQLAALTRSITHVGWGIDMVAANSSVIGESDVNKLAGECWRPSDSFSDTGCRVPVVGTLDALIQKHVSFLNRLASDGFAPVPPLSTFRVVSYRRATDPISRPFAIFELRNEDGSFFRYPQERLIHIAGMARHLAIEMLDAAALPDVPDDWVEVYVAGHARPESKEHRQFSYLPLASIGHAHTDPSVRRLMIAAPVGDASFLRQLARRLDGQQLKPTARTKLDHPPTLVRVKRDNLARFYVTPANAWASVTPVILPGHDDHKPDKTRKLIEKALQQSGIDQRCEFDWSAFSHFPKSLSAHKYDRQRRSIGYLRPNHLLDQTAVHLKLRFNDGLKVSGPLAIGSGRHCGLGLMAGIDQ